LSAKLPEVVADMNHSESTCWTVIDAASAGSPSDREAFAKYYLPSIKGYFRNRWRNSVYIHLVEDGVQDVFVECFRSDGPLARADRDRQGGFRPFLYGVVRNVALRLESRKRSAQQNVQSSIDLNAVVADEETLSVQFDRAWATSMMRQAAELQAAVAAESNEAAVRRVELLRLRFQEGLAIREIAARWNEDPATLHHEYAKARQEFKSALAKVVSFHHSGSTSDVQHECEVLLQILG
jgi:RNA polymerase sigma-70 factor (ECF subfamily)